MRVSGQTNIVSIKENQFKCSSCQSVHPLYTVKHTTHFACPECKTNFVYSRNKWTEKKQKWEFKYTPSYIKLGDKATFYDKTYQVIGITHKRHRKWRFSWIEYILFDRDSNSYLTLTERKGHWNLFEPQKRDLPKYSFSKELGINYKGDQYRMYDKYNCEVLWAAGEFHWDPLEETKSLFREFIAPPHTYILELKHKVRRWYKGKYLKPKEVREALGLSESLPSSKGMDPAKPIIRSMKKEEVYAYVGTFSAALFAVLILFAMFQPSTRKHVTNNLVPKAQGENVLKDSVYVDGGIFGRNNLKVKINTDINYGWLETTVVLHDITRNQYYGKKVSIEYYSGVTDGESWTEGDKDESFVFPNLPEGPYNILVYDAFSKYKSTKASIRIEQGVSVWGNLIAFLLLAAIYPLVRYAYVQIMERWRWKDSEYSPFDNE